MSEKHYGIVGWVIRGTVNVDGAVNGKKVVVSMSVPSGAVVVLGLTATAGSTKGSATGQLLLGWATREPST
jgi:hypothetical protein